MGAVSSPCPLSLIRRANSCRSVENLAYDWFCVWLAFFRVLDLIQSFFLILIQLSSCTLGSVGYLPAEPEDSRSFAGNQAYGISVQVLLALILSSTLIMIQSISNPQYLSIYPSESLQFIQSCSRAGKVDPKAAAEAISQEGAGMNTDGKAAKLAKLG